MAAVNHCAFLLFVYRWLLSIVILHLHLPAHQLSPVRKQRLALRIYEAEPEPPPPYDRGTPVYKPLPLPGFHHTPVSAGFGQSHGQYTPKARRRRYEDKY